MLTGMIRRFAGIGSAASIVALAGLSTAASTPAAAAVVAGCTVSGSASIVPGLAPTPGTQNTSFTGSATCTGVNGTTPVVNATGGFSGSVTCAEGSIELGVLCSISFNATVAGATEVCSASPAFVQVGALVVEACVTASTDVEVGAVAFTPSPLIQNPVTSVTFTGVAVVV